MQIKKTLLSVKRYFLLSVAIFILSTVLGVVFVEYQPDIAEESMTELQERFSFIDQMSAPALGAFIFFNNSIKILIFIFLGIIFIVPTIFFLVVNGFVLGFVIASVYSDFGVSRLFHSLFYHGIFEFTALFIGTSLGIKLGISFIKEIGRCDKKKLIKNIQNSTKLKEDIKLSFNIFLVVILPLLLIAAVIETTLIYLISTSP